MTSTCASTRAAAARARWRISTTLSHQSREFSFQTPVSPRLISTRRSRHNPLPALQALLDRRRFPLGVFSLFLEVLAHPRQHEVFRSTLLLGRALVELLHHVEKLRRVEKLHRYRSPLLLQLTTGFYYWSFDEPSSSLLPTLHAAVIIVTSS